MKKALPYWLATLTIEDSGPIQINRWLAANKTLPSLFKASSDELKSFGFKEKSIHSIRHPNWEKISQDLKWCETNNCEIIPCQDPRFPPLLKEIADPPLLLFAQGNVDLLLKPQIAIVGSRSPTPQGEHNALQFARVLSEHGLVITSGMALGIDAASHLGALKGLKETIAVFGTGLQHIYPASHKPLAKEILKTGLILSEFLPNTSPKPYHFPKRNRIIAGLSWGVLVVEAALRSGSLITAQMAAEYGREVFAIPGSIHNPLTRGCHQLICEGAKLVEKVEDILVELKNGYLPDLKAASGVMPQNPPLLDEKLRQLLKEISYDITPTDVIAVRSGLTASEVSSMLLSLELLGYISHSQGGYAKKPELKR